MSAVIEVRAVSFSYTPHAALAVRGVNLQVDAGEMVGLLGPNGSGKSTLLRLIVGALRSSSGTVRYLARAIEDWPRAELARSVGVVAQHEDLAFPLTVRELVSMGRYPHLGAWRREGAADVAAIDNAMTTCRVADLAARSVLELSGGERQRARVARALAQQPRTLLLDEPAASLDIAHEMALIELLAQLRDNGVTIVLATHNINIAARYCDRLLLLAGGSIAACGSPAEVVTRASVEAVYEWPVIIRTEDGAPQVVPLRASHSHDLFFGGPR